MGVGTINLAELVTPLVQAEMRKELAAFSRKLATAFKQALEDDAAAKAEAASSEPQERKSRLSPAAIERIREGQRKRRNKAATAEESPAPAGAEAAEVATVVTAAPGAEVEGLVEAGA